MKLQIYNVATTHGQSTREGYPFTARGHAFIATKTASGWKADDLRTGHSVERAFGFHHTRKGLIGSARKALESDELFERLTARSQGGAMLNDPVNFIT